MSNMAQRRANNKCNYNVLSIRCENVTQKT